MKRLRCCLLVLGMCLFCVSTARAQQDPGFVPVWDDSLNFIDSLIFQTADGRLVIDTTTTPDNPILTLNNSGSGPVLQVNGLTSGTGSTAVSVTQTGFGGGTGLQVSTAAVVGQAIFARCTTTGPDDCSGLLASGAFDGVQAIGGHFGVAANGGTVGVRGFSAAGTGAQFETGSGNILIGMGGVTRRFRVDASGNVFATSYNLGGADFAESVEPAGPKDGYEAGDVMVIDQTAMRRVELARQPYSTLVAGIYSTKAGILASPYHMDDPRLAKEIPLAIVGIVPCKVSAENGPIKAGDLLVTSPTPGYAMKGSKRSRMLGAVIGKALEPVASGKSVIQVLVTLQ